jgi:hypothetical protein
MESKQVGSKEQVAAEMKEMNKNMFKLGHLTKYAQYK